MTMTVLASLYLVTLLGKVLAAMRAARRSPSAALTPDSRVVIAQPILSGDPGLEATLEANVAALPSMHFVWLVDADDVIAQATCAAIAARHTDVDIEIMRLPPAPDGVNPKLFKLEAARTALSDRLMCVVDDDVRVPAETLGMLCGGLRDSMLATALPAYIDDGRWPSQLLAQFVNNNAAVTYLPLLNVAPPPTINGMAYIIDGMSLSKIDGFGPAMRSITDDLAVAQHVVSHGGRLCQIAAPVWVQTTVRDWGHYVRQMHRWYLFALVLFRQQSVGLQLLISLLNAAPSMALWGLGLSALASPSWRSAALVAIVLALRAGLLSVVQRRVYGRRLYRPIMSEISELLQPCHLVHACCVRQIVWRTRRYRVRLSGGFEAVR